MIIKIVLQQKILVLSSPNKNIVLLGADLIIKKTTPQLLKKIFQDSVADPDPYGSVSFGRIWIRFRQSGSG